MKSWATVRETSEIAEAIFETGRERRRWRRKIWEEAGRSAGEGL
ncbi:hypothetical protein M8494_07385 [Serratia ureilytica]